MSWNFDCTLIQRCLLAPISIKRITSSISKLHFSPKSEGSIYFSVFLELSKARITSCKECKKQKSYGLFSSNLSQKKRFHEIVVVYSIIVIIFCPKFYYYLLNLINESIWGCTSIIHTNCVLSTTRSARHKDVWWTRSESSWLMNLCDELVTPMVAYLLI